MAAAVASMAMSAAEISAIDISAKKHYRDKWVVPLDKERLVSDRQIATVIPGNTCKIKNPLGEKFWVIFIKRNDAGELIGQVNNELILGSEYNNHDLVVFPNEAIWDIMDDGRRVREQKKLVDIAFAFFLLYGRKPTFEEIDALNMKITHIP
jgi:hypothetical protein